jgi:hypothetical protein
MKTKSEYIAAILEEIGLSKVTVTATHVDLILKAQESVILQRLVPGEPVVIPGVVQIDLVEAVGSESTFEAPLDHKVRFQSKLRLAKSKFLGGRRKGSRKPKVEPKIKSRYERDPVI